MRSQCRNRRHDGTDRALARARMAPVREREEMVVLGAFLGAAFWWAVLVLVFRRDRRRVRNGLLLLIAVYATVSLVLRFWATAIPLGDLLTLALAVMLLLGVLALAVVL